MREIGAVYLCIWIKHFSIFELKLTITILAINSMVSNDPKCVSKVYKGLLSSLEPELN